MTTASTILYGCNSSETSSQKSSSAINSIIKPATCPKQPNIALQAKNVEEITLSDTILNKSGNVSDNQAIGYKFTAQKGERISLSTSNSNICIWVYSPDNQIISGGKLPTTGKYIMQISALQGQQNFDIQLQLLDIVLTQDMALNIVQKWYSAKPKIFAPPFDTSLAEGITTGNFYQNLISDEGSVAWLKKYDSYYEYKESKIVQVRNFRSNEDSGLINVQVVEELYLHGPKGIDQKNSGRFIINGTYYFIRDNGVWKISDVKKI
ncbi:ARC6/PARC6 family protein [Anabaena sp. FACHB-1237]|nr:ARC6/PARC6 family protein [Anabaena sp. FACHB-1237]